MRAGQEQRQGRANREDLLKRLDELTVNDGLNGAGEGEGLSEAERLARDAVPPKRRKDGEIQGTPKTRPLTSSQMEFAKGLIAGKTQLEAYRIAYPNAQGNEKGIKTSAWKLSQDRRIQRILQDHWGETVEALTEDAIAVKRYVMRNLLDLSKNAKQEGSKLKALEMMGKSVGLFKPQITDDDDDVSAEQLKRELAQHLKLMGNVRRITKAQVIDLPSTVISADSVSVPVQRSAQSNAQSDAES